MNRIYHDYRICNCDDNNITKIRSQYPKGLHFVVGDTHGECETLKTLLKKIEFNPEKDHVYFVGDYNGGGDIRQLMHFLSIYYQGNYNLSGFHLIRGNHERELCPLYPLENLPDIIVYRGEYQNYYIVHAGMISEVFNLINEDIAQRTEKKVFAYKLDDKCVAYDAPLRQIIWSRNGLYSQNSKWHTWPSEKVLYEKKSCIIHGHTPYCFLKKGSYHAYGDRNIYWKKQHIWFSEDLQSFNIDSNIKGKFLGSEYYRGLSCICLEVFDNISSKNFGRLFSEDILNSENGVFSVPYVSNQYDIEYGDINKILNAKLEMKIITLNINNSPYIK